jgi:acyl-CoA synthetase (AMP-forming)/AMP-acid ligase II
MADGTMRDGNGDTCQVLSADSMAISERTIALPVVPMFHANAWGIPHACVAAGADIIMPGPHLAPKPLAELIEGEKVRLLDTSPAPPLHLPCVSARSPPS